MLFYLLGGAGVCGAGGLPEVTAGGGVAELGRAAVLAVEQEEVHKRLRRGRVPRAAAAVTDSVGAGGLHSTAPKETMSNPKHTNKK